jgi:hypothetical protein
MPEISRFFGIVISMHAKDHLPPHFHAKYGDYRAIITIKTGELLDGTMSRRALRLIQDWVELHQDELLANFEESQKDNPNLRKIASLE